MWSRCNIARMELIPLDECSANDRCPECGRHGPRRVSSNTGDRIWTFTETCKCGYRLHFENVRV